MSLYYDMHINNKYYTLLNRNHHFKTKNLAIIIDIIITDKEGFEDRSLYVCPYTYKSLLMSTTSKELLQPSWFSENCGFHYICLLWAMHA